jgi:hypothetical protein
VCVVNSINFWRIVCLTNLYSNTEYRAAIDAADEKYNAEVKVSGAKVKAQPNMADIKSRATKAAA